MLERFISFCGMILILLIAWTLSTNRKQVKIRIIVWGLALQIAFALFIHKTLLGQMLFQLAGDLVNRLIGFANEGCKFVFGSLADTRAMSNVFGEKNGLIFAITVTGTIIIVASLSSLFYHYGILQRVVRAMAWVMRKAMRTSGSETLSAAANIFMGQTEAPLLIKPYISGMTRSELLCMMVGGMATIAGGVLAAYVSFGIPAGDLLTASVMNAPAALLISKILLPETEQSQTAAGMPAFVERQTSNGLDALCRGASEGMTLSINVIAMLIAFVATINLANFLLESILSPFGIHTSTPLQTLFAWLNAPFAIILGVPFKDALAVGSVLGERIVLNEFIGYLSLVKLKDLIEPRSFTIATYAICGFANFTSIAIQIGGIGSIVPERRKDLARLGVRAMIGGVLATYLSASIIGILYGK
ncbi:MAG: NupC/NupG family nucleoside CNT transporter [Verrucomicrobiia bacterium]|jgi:CNT family concentrative nucleoside transporter